METHSSSQEMMDVDDKDGGKDAKNSNVSPDQSPNDCGQGNSESNESGEKLRKHIEKDDSGISVEKSENSSDENTSSKTNKQKDKKSDERSENNDDEIDADDDSSGFRGFHDWELRDGFPRLRSRLKNRNYRKRTAVLSSDDETPCSSAADGTVDSFGKGNHSEGVETKEDSVPDNVPVGPDEVDIADSDGGSDGKEEPSVATRRRHSGSRSNSGSGVTEGADSNSSDEDEEPDVTPPVLLKAKPKHSWFVTKEVVNRQLGFPARCQGPMLFHQRCYGSLHAVQRLELMYKLESHHGCVNALHFNSSGTMLASGSDDLGIVIWDWAVGKSLLTFDSGHKSNVFQVKFLPLQGDTHVVSCGRDGQVRLSELSSTNQCRATRRLAQHRGPAHKLSVLPDSPHVILSSGEDAFVMSIDVRVPKPEKLVLVKDREKKIALYSIHSNPLDSNQFCVSGRNCAVRIYDRRHCSEGGGTPVAKFWPAQLGEKCADSGMHVTCAVFNHDGTELLASYNDEDIYLFDTRASSGTEFIHRYEGHRNNATVKGVSFFGPRSEFIVSGSDCGHIYFWEKNTEAIMQFMRGDENGVVNCLEPHPQIPVIATSGLDDDVKIWVPSCEHEPPLQGLKTAVQRNRRAREEDTSRDPDTFDGQMLWILWRHIRRTERHRFAGRGARDESAPDLEEASSSDGGSSDSSEGAAEGRLQCSPS